MSDNIVLGIDVGASGIKGALVDVISGELVSERHRIPTPDDAMPADIAACIKAMTKHFDWAGLVGCGFPAVVKEGQVFTASNIDNSWIGVRIDKLLTDTTGCPVVILNDADAAGIGEIKFGKYKNTKGTVILITIGSGLGTVLFNNGHLFPNTEFGQLKMGEKIAEKLASDAVRKREELDWEVWGKRFGKYLRYLEKLLWPTLFILGGGSSKKFGRYKDYLKSKTPVVPATLLNNAGIVGAAYHAHQLHENS